MSLRYDTSTWKGRPTLKIWESLKKYIGYPQGTTNFTLPPDFGYICDKLRNNYGVYVSVTPHIQTVTNKEGTEIESSLVFHFYGTVIVMKEIGTPTNKVSYTGIDYDTVMRDCLMWAGKHLN